MQQTENGQTPKTIYLKDYRPADYVIEHFDLTFELNPRATKTRSIISVKPNPVIEDEDRANSLELNGEGLTLHEIKLNGQVLSDADYAYDNKILTLKNLDGKSFLLETLVETDPVANTSLNGLYSTNDVFCTQCEAEGFRNITFALDRPDVLSTYKVKLIGDKKTEPVLLSNGNLLEEGEVDDQNHYAIWEDPHPKPTYLFALVAGELDYISDNFTTGEGREVALNIYVEKGKTGGADFAMGALKRSFKWDEEEFGRYYDLDIFNIVAVPQFNMGAMENKGLNIFNDKYILADKKTATDMDFELIEAIIGHEYFHNWTGNRITCRDWFQLCLKEGLTVYRDAEFTSMLRSRAAKRIDDVKTLRAGQFPEDRGAMAHGCRPESYISIDNFYTATVYRKGAEVVRALARLVGKDGFRKALDLYFDRFDGQAVTVLDFLKCFEDTSGRDLKQFDLWYQQAGTPELEYVEAYDADAQSYTLTISQSCPATPNQPTKKPYHMPIQIGLLDSKGEDMPLNINGEVLENDLLELTEAKQSFTLENVAEKPVLSFLRDFSAPVKVMTKQSEAEKLFLMAHDQDPINRWQASQDLATQIILDLMEEGADEAQILNGQFANSLKQTLENDTLDNALKANILAMPTIGNIVEVIVDDIDHDKIHQARQKLLKHLSVALKDVLLAQYNELMKDQSFETDAKGAAVRSLRGALLGLMAYQNDADSLAIAKAHYQKANNMVDQVVALEVLHRFDAHDPKAEMTDFYDQYKDNHLVIDKWFTLQARCVSKDAIEHIKSLTEHEKFSFETPNNIYALILNFAMGNLVAFNQKDGAAYEYMADLMIKVDGINPQVASRMANAFRSYRNLESSRKSKAETALKRVINVNNISPNLYEMVSKMLA